MMVAIRSAIIIWLLLLCKSLDAQKEDFQWIFNWTSVDSCSLFPTLEEHCGASILDFNYDPPMIYKNSKVTLDMWRSNSALCNQDGKLILYSNGQAIYDFTHNSIISGDTINFGEVWEDFSWENENGEVRSQGLRHSQLVNMVKIPDKENEYFIFYKNFDDFERTGFLSLKMSTIIENENGDLEVVDKDMVLNSQLQRFDQTNMCQHGNGRDWWMLHNYQDSVYTYLVNPGGVHLKEVQVLPFSIQTILGEGKFNLNGNKYALYGSTFGEEQDIRELALFDFDRCTGLLSNPLLHISEDHELSLNYSCEFSPSGQFLYVQTLDTLFQYDVWDNDIFSTETIIATWDGFDKDILGFDNFSYFSLLRLGPNNKMYCPASGQNSRMHVIHYPDRKGVDCLVEQRAFDIPTYVFATVPTHNTLRLGPIDGSACDTLDIDNHPVARFRYEADTFDILDIDFIDLSYYRPEEWFWDFDDGGMISREKSPTHRFSRKGVYNVCLTVSNENSSHTTCDTLNLGMVSSTDITDKIHVSIFPNPTADFLRVAYHNYVPLNSTIVLYDGEGRRVSQKRLLGVETLVDLSDVEAGVYYYEIQDQGEVVSRGKVVRVE